MQIKHIVDTPISSILKNNLYLNGVMASDKVFELLNSSQYNGYRTTTGIFIKLGGTLSKIEFYKLKQSDENYTFLSEISDNLTYENYLKIREYSTVALKKLSCIDKNAKKNNTYFILDIDEKGKLYIVGQYFKDNKSYSIKINDCAVFKQDNYIDDCVVLQAGGIRLRASICGDNCISGCKFCDFGSASKTYIKNNLNEQRKNYIINRIRQLASNAKVQTLFITGGNPCLEDLNKWTEFVKESITTFKEIVPNGSIDIMLTPRGFNRYVYDDKTRFEEYKKYLLYLKSIGVNTISPNMELWNQEDLSKFCSVNTSRTNIGSTKSEIGHNGYIDFIKAGIEVFGKYNVRTSLIIGLNSINDVKEAIKYLLPLGCYVVLLPFKAPNKFLKSSEPYDYDLTELSNYLSNETRNILNSLTIDLSKIYSERISNSLNAHNTHNTANLCCGQDLDIIEKDTLNSGYNKDIFTGITDVK